jgi:anti-anti-sigma factor
VAEFRETGSNGTRSVSMSGEIDLAVTDEVVAAVRSCLSRAEHVELDLTDVSFIDSSGLGAFVLLRNEAIHQGKQLTLVNLSPATSRLLRITGLESSFDIRSEPV